MCNNMVCGGKSISRVDYALDVSSKDTTPRSCEKFDGEYRFTPLPVKLVQPRVGHLCWGLKTGDVLLLGGMVGGQWDDQGLGRLDGARKTTERVSADGSSSSLDFELGEIKM